MPSALHIEPVRGEPGGYELRLALGAELRVLRDPECRILWRSAIVIAAAAAARSEPEPTPPTPPPAANEPPSTPAPAPPVAPSPATPRALPPPPSPPPIRRRPARTRPRRPPAPPSAEARERRAPERAAPASTGLAAPESDELRAGLGLGVGVSGGVLPDLGGVLEVGGRLEALPWAIDASVRYWPERSRSREGRVVEVTGAGVRLAGLVRVASALNLSAGIEVNRLVGEGAEGVSGRNADTVWQLAPSLGFSLITWDIGVLRLEIGAAARLSLARPRFVVTGYGDLYRVPLLGADAIIRGVWLFP